MITLSKDNLALVVGNAIAEAERLTNGIPQKDFLTPDEAAEYLGYTVKSLYNLVSAKKIPHIKLNTANLLFSKSDLKTWVEGHRVAPAQ